ncbi:MAG TPA: Hsp70 family protein [Methylocella sp.]|nr:Hsp70 family protein [Methylocella sp.]
MAQPKFSIGIDLGTSNSVLAFSPLSGEGGSEVLAIPQWDTPSTVTESATVPSFLYLPEEAVAAQIRGRGLGSGAWVVGKLAQRKASETPGRVAKSTKSWLCHHAADRSAPFLPWGSDALAQQDKISPVFASALILVHLRAAWNARFAGQGSDFEFDAQDITITVPASFDAAAQRLTLAAAQQAGFPGHVRLLEEPQAAFYWWLEQQTGHSDPWSVLPNPQTAARHVLVIDVGGGTSDFSLFELRQNEGSRDPGITRVAVSDHILLGGDNIDLAIAHLLEPRLAASEGGLSAGQWDHLVARCRSLKESVLGCEAAPDEVFTVSIPGRGSSLFAGSLSAQVTRAELEALLLDGFFPDCLSTDRPMRALGAIKEWGLPYAFDGAITRHLAAFLRGRPGVDAVLFNGGSLRPSRLRGKLREQIGKWQEGRPPQVLENAQLDLAVAHGAAYSGRLLHLRAGRIEGGAARAVFLEAQRKAPKGGGEAARRSLVCIVPHGAVSEQAFELADHDLRLRINRPVRFQVYTSTRHDELKAGDVVELVPEEFHALPPLETAAAAAELARGELAFAIPVALIAKVNELGLLQVSCRSLASDIPQSWPLEFNLRPHDRNLAAPAREPAPPAQAKPNVAPDALAAAERRIGAAFAQSSPKAEKLTAPRLFQSLEQILGRSKGDWNAILLRDLWTSLEASQTGRALSVEHEEAWLILAGFLLRPGFGVAMDQLRIDGLWGIRGDGLRFPGKRTKLQEYILWRRVAGGLSRERQEIVLVAEKDKIGQPKSVSSELIRMAGSFERIGHELKAELIGRFIETVVELASQQKHCAPYLAALGLLLNRTPFYAGPESVVPPALVEKAYEAFRRFGWNDPEFEEAQVLFLRAARAVDDRRLDLPKSMRNHIADRLEKCGIAPVKTGRLRNVVPVERLERLSSYGEAVPPGLILSE